MTFTKGQKPWNKGIPHLEEIKKKISNTKKGTTPWNKGKRGLQHSTEELKKRISERMIGNQYGFKKNHSPWNKGKKNMMPEPWNKNKKYKQITGNKNPNWQGGITPINSKIRESLEMKIFRRKVFERDDYRCMSCGERGYKIVVDHILPFWQFPRLRFDPNNGRVLCQECHKQTNTYLNKAKNFSLEGRPVIFLTQ